MNAIRDYLGHIPPGWDTIPIQSTNGTHYGDVMIQGNEVHIAIDAKHRRRVWSRRIIRSFLGDLLADKHFLTTRSKVGDDTEAFIQRLGFTKTNEDATFRYWWLDALPFERTAP